MSDTDNRTLELAEDAQSAVLDNQLAKLRGVLKQSSQLRFSGWDGQTCFDCGSDLAKNRLANFRVRCVPCQTLAERVGQG